MKSSKVTIVQNILTANDHIANDISAILKKHNIFSVNIMASPGAGKTSLIMQTIHQVSKDLRLGIIEGDTAPVTIDADKVSAVGIPVVQINTGGQCHLDALMIKGALSQFSLDELDLIIVENVGNLICPAAFKLGTAVNVVIASIPEGDDKPYKYPGIYHGIDALILNKIDLKPYVDFDLEYFRKGVEALNPRIEFFELSCKTGDGLYEWIYWLRGMTASY